MPKSNSDQKSAGDVFRAGMLYGLLQHWRMHDCFTLAKVAGALACCKIGGSNPPSWQDTWSLYKTQKNEKTTYVEIDYK